MWEIDINDQAVTFLLSLALGVILCLLYDIFRALRRVFDYGSIAVFIQDILFWLISAFITFMFLMGRTGGGLRGYVFIAALAGFTVFRLTLSRPITAALAWVFSGVYRIYRFINGRVYAFLGLVGRLFIRFGGFFAKKSKTAPKTLKKLLKSRAHLLYTEKNNDERGE